MHMFRKFASLLSLGALFMSLSACAGGNAGLNRGGNALNADRPKDETCRTELKREVSTLNIGIEATSGELENMLNRLVPKVLYKGSTKTSGVTADLVRTAPITVTATDGFIHLTIPISMSLSYSMFQTPAVATKLKFKLSPHVTPDWKLVAEVSYTGLTDLLAEDLRMGPLSLKPRSLVEGVTQPIQHTLSDLISRKFNEQFPLRAKVGQVWNLAHKPVLLDKKYGAWLAMTPQEITLYPLYAQKNRIRLSVGLRSYAEVVVGPEPAPRAPAPLPNLKLARGADQSFRIALNTDLFYKDLRAIAQPLLIDRELGSDGRSVKLKDLDVYGNGDHLMVKVVTTGDLDGTFYLTCRPAFNPETNVFSVEDVDFEMQTKSLLLKSADWFLHGTIRNTIREKLNMDLTGRLAQAKEVAGKAIARVNLADNLVLTGNVKKLMLNDVMVQKDKISLQLYAEGETAIALH